MSASVFLVHPDASVRKTARNTLVQAGYRVRESGDLKPRELANPAIVLVAWTSLSPLADSLRRLRMQAGTRDARILVLARRQDLGAAINALEYGADDCITTPLDSEELLVRISASLRRPVATASEDKLRAGPIVLDRRVHEVLVNDEAVSLAPTEFRLMAFLLENQGRVFGRNELLSRAWPSNIKAGQRTVDVHVRRLRQQLEPYGCEDMIQTVRGFGYRLRAE